MSATESWTETLGPDDLVACDGEVLREWRWKAGCLSQREAAEALEIDPEEYGRIERGECRARLRTVVRITERANGISLGELVLGPDAQPKARDSGYAYMKGARALGGKIELLRLQLGYERKAEAARRGGISPQLWSRAERSKRLKGATLRAIADVLGVSCIEIAVQENREMQVQRFLRSSRFL